MDISITSGARPVRLPHRGAAPPPGFPGMPGVNPPPSPMPVPDLPLITTWPGPAGRFATANPPQPAQPGYAQSGYGAAASALGKP